ncbi:MAG: hypothetical protein QOI51_1061 [Nocardioidaceae bacterium]|nr:hypothetical protein [Nocardioidaceae bacterium]
MPLSSPTSRVLSVLERLQERPGLSARLLASEIGVDKRTVRRYVASLRDMGIPIEPIRGKNGGYRLRQGYRMPPLMFTTDEAVAVTLAVAAMQRGAVEDPEDPGGDPAISTALEKLARVLPRHVASRMTMVRAAVSAPPELESPGPHAPHPALLVPLAEAVVGQRRCRVRHRSQGGAITVREVNPYGLVVLDGGWYLHAWCHLRQARRTFRIDRIDRVDVLVGQFSAPQGLDVVAAVEESLALARPEWAVTMLVQAPLSDVQDHVPRRLGVLEAVGPRETRLRSSTSNLDYFVWRVSDLPFAMTVVTPDELRVAFGRHAERLLAVAHGYASRHG